MVQIQIEFDELLKAIDQLSEEQKQLVQNHLSGGNVTHVPAKKRVAGLGEGTIWMSDDFIDPLPDEFWLGEE